MRTRSTRFLCAHLAAALISLPGAALAEQGPDLIDGEGTQAVESESLGTLEDYAWAPVGIGRALDMVIMRPLALGLTGVSALTYSFAVIPSLVRGDDERASELYVGLIREPFRYAVLRPPFTPPDHFKLLEEEREAEEALAIEAAENARLEEIERREAAKALAADEARAEARARQAGDRARAAGSETATGADDTDGKAEAGERPPQ